MALEVERKEKKSATCFGIVAPVHFANEPEMEREREKPSFLDTAASKNTRSVNGKAKLQRHVNRYEMWSVAMHHFISKLKKNSLAQ
jgi:hypothetical protein